MPILHGIIKGSFNTLGKADPIAAAQFDIMVV
jgi:hypothetical protein